MNANTFIVGAPKAGTTSLHHYLSQHEEVCMSAVKEPNHFSHQEVSSLFYKSLSVSDSQSYQKLYAEEKTIMGEASVSYLFYEKVPQRIYDYNSNAKIIIMLRQPIERAFSHYLMDSRLGFCSLSLEEIISNPEKHPQYFQQYLELGKYHSQLKRYLDTFGKDQIKIIFYEDFKNNTQQQMHALFEFLNIKPQQLNLSVQNPFLSPSKGLISKLYTFNWIRKSVKFLLPLRLIQSVKSIFFSAQSKPKLAKDTQEQLKAFYKEDVYRLEKLLNVDLSRWKIS